MLLAWSPLVNIRYRSNNDQGELSLKGHLCGLQGRDKVVSVPEDLVTWNESRGSSWVQNLLGTILVQELRWEGYLEGAQD